MTGYQIGDPVVDLAQGRAMVVLGAPGQTVAEWNDANDYNLLDNYANSKLGAAMDDAVVRCVYVSDIRSEPSKDYTFPESRLALIDAHHADGGRRVAERVAVEVLADLFDMFIGTDDEKTVTRGARAKFDDDLVDEAKELADVAVTIGGDDA